MTFNELGVAFNSRYLFWPLNLIILTFIFGTNAWQAQGSQVELGLGFDNCLVVFCIIAKLSGRNKYRELKATSNSLKVTSSKSRL